MLAITTVRSAFAQLPEGRQHVRVGTELERTEHGSAGGRVVEVRQLERPPHLLRTAVAQPLEALAVGPLEMVIEVVRDLRHEAGASALFTHLEARLSQQPLKPRSRWLELDERAERVE